MREEYRRIRWIIDEGLPQIESIRPDVTPLSTYTLDLITEALQQKRWILTSNRLFLTDSDVPSNCPPIVIVDSASCSVEGLLRNLLHLEFHLLKNEAGFSQLVNSTERFFIEMDKSTFKINSKGGFEELESWKVPSLAIPQGTAQGAPA